MPYFLFDRNFDADPTPPPEAAPVADVPKGLSGAALAAALDAARAEGFEAGRAAGLEEAGAEREAAVAQTVGQISGTLEALQLDLSAHLRQREYDLAQLVLALAQKLLPELLDQVSTRRLEAFCRQSLRLLEGDGAAQLFVPEAEYDALSVRLEAALAGPSVTLLPDAELEAGSARAQWQNGHATFALETLHDTVLAALRDAVAATRDQRIIP